MDHFASLHWVARLAISAGFISILLYLISLYQRSHKAKRRAAEQEKVTESRITSVLTERKQMERALLESNALMQAILDGANYSIITTRLDGTIFTFNAAAERMLGYRAEEVVDKYTPEIIHDLQEVTERAEGLSRELGRPVSPGFEVFVAKAMLEIAEEREWTYIRKDGSRFPVLLSVTAIRTPDGTAIGYMGIAYDITERKQIERMKNEFISTVSHELRTPLTSIRGSLGLIAEGFAGPLAGETAPLIDIALRNCERLSRLINDILDLDKIESGKMNFNMKPADVTSLMEQAITANQAYAEQFNVVFVLKETIPGAKVNADSDRLIQVLTNLLSNAAKFSQPSESVILSVSRRNRQVRVEIADRGPGIPEEFRPQLFQKFAQGDSSNARQKGGTGLGLSIAKAIVENHGGTIGYETVLNVGTTFYFELPEYVIENGAI